MRKISFETSDEGYEKMIDLLRQLTFISKSGVKRVIRIGGNEKEFDGNIDIVYNLMVDGVKDNGVYNQSSLSKNKKTSRKNTTNSTSDNLVDLNDSNNSDDKKNIEDIVVEMIDAGKLFTAYDVTQEARNRGIFKCHNVIKKIVHEMFKNEEMPNYIKGTIQIDGKITNPIVYHPIGTDSDDYFLLNNHLNGMAIH